MFTGIVEELGTVKKVMETSSGKQFVIKAKTVMDDLQIGDSIAVNGVCLTVVKTTKTTFTLDLVFETLDKSNLGEMEVGTQINLERALTLSTRLGGHILQGHVETVGVILDKETSGDGATMVIGMDPSWLRYCIPKGSIALDGVSLTIASMKDNLITVALIPHTLECTTLGFKENGATLNVETDIIGKYIDRLLSIDEDEDETGDTYMTGLMTWGIGES